MTTRETRTSSASRIAYQGVMGAFSETAALQFAPDGDAVGYPSFEDAFKAAVRGECRYACLPVENSLAGSINQTYDLLTDSVLHVVAEQVVRVHHNLLARPGTKISEIERVYSHTQARQQCANVSRKHGIEAVTDVGFEVRAGEVFGIAGVDGNGQAELVEAITGLRDPETGRIAFDGADITDRARRRITDAGLAFAELYNPLLDDGPDADEPLSAEERSFYLDHAKENLDDEYAAMVKTAQAVNEGNNRPTSLTEHIAELNTDWSQSQADTMRSGLVSRMYELGLISRERVGQRGIAYNLTETGESLLDDTEVISA
jgi:energy-coupling factor transporter ATP-binding protein EcfA2